MSEFADLEKPILGIPRMRGRTVVYVPNHRSFGAFMRSQQMRDVTTDVADDIAVMAAGNTPTRKGGKVEERTGLHARVKGGFKVKNEGRLMKVAGNLRVRVDVVNTEPGSALLEFGGRGMPRRRMLGRAGARFGDFKPEGGPG
jgi:hypothetical protein